MLKNRLDWSNQEDIAQLVTSLKQGKVSICTTDTVFGLIAPLTEPGFEKLNELKGRSEKPYLLLIPDAQSISRFSNSNVSVTVERIINSCWPGPLTLIFEAKESLPGYIKSKDGTVALRVPDHAGLQSVMAHIGPVFSTSANRQGQPTPATIQAIDPAILAGIDYVVVDDKAMNGEVVPSTILDCSGDQIQIIREGSYSISALEAIAEQKFIF